MDTWKQASSGRRHMKDRTSKGVRISLDSYRHQGLRKSMLVPGAVPENKKHREHRTTPRI